MKCMLFFHINYGTEGMLAFGICKCVSDSAMNTDRRCGLGLQTGSCFAERLCLRTRGTARGRHRHTTDPLNRSGINWNADPKEQRDDLLTDRKPKKTIMLMRNRRESISIPKKVVFGGFLSPLEKLNCEQKACRRWGMTTTPPIGQRLPRHLFSHTGAPN